MESTALALRSCDPANSNWMVCFSPRIVCRGILVRLVICVIAHRWLDIRQNLGFLKILQYL